MKKSVLFLAVLTVFVSLDAFAVASVKKLGTSNVSANPAKSAAVLPKAQVGGGAIQAKAAVVPVGRGATTDANARLSAGVSSIKAISSGNLTTIRPADVEIDVVESGTGNYVTDVSMRGDNKLGVTKTNLLYAPVRQGSSDTIVDTAEIWIVK
jgi:hypothetical protein